MSVDEEVTTGQEVATREPSPGVALDGIESWMQSKGYGAFKVLDDGRRVLELSDELKKQAILAGPATNLVQIDRNWSPQLRPMRIDVNNTQAAFKVGSVKVGQGQYEDVMDLAAPAWAQLGGLCGISRARVQTVRWPNGKGLDVHVTAKMRQPDGNWLQTTASSDYDYDVEAELLEIDIIERWEKFEKPKSNGKARPSDGDIRKQVLRQRQFAARTAETKAFSRCVKALTGLRTFRKSELATKPLMAVAWLMTPDLNDPGSRELVKMQYADASLDLYGEGGDAVGQLPEVTYGSNMGEEIPDTVTVLDASDVEEVDADPETGEVVEAAATAAAPAATAQPAPADGAQTAAAPAAAAAPPAQDATAVAESAVEGEEWDMDDGSAEDVRPPRPDASKDFKPKGPFEGKSASEIVATAEGRKWLADIAKRMGTPEKRQIVLDWLSFQLGRVITVDNLDSVE